MAESILAKISVAVKTGVKATGRVFVLVPKALIYPIKKPFASMSEVKHDAKVSLKEAVGIDIPEEEKKYDPSVKTTEASEYLGVQITKQGKGKVSFLAPRTLTGDIPHLSPEKLDEISKNLPNVTIFREENKIVIEINVEEIANTIKTNSDNKGKSEKEIKELVLKAIDGEVDRNLKGLAKITAGEFKVHTDQKLLYGTAKKLYSGYNSKKQQSQEVVRPMDKERSSEKISDNWQKAVKQDFESCESIRGRGNKLWRVL